MENSVRVRHDLPPAPGSGAALCRRLRASSRRFHRPAGQIQRQGRTQNWIKLGGKVKGSKKVKCKVAFASVAGVTRAKLSRGGVTYAAGRPKAAGDRLVLRFSRERRLKPGRYLLTVVQSLDGRRVATRSAVRVS